MNRREILHEIVDRLPEEDLPTAMRVLKGLELTPGPLQVLLTEAPIDDEPFDPADLEGEEGDREPLIPHDEVMKRFRDGK